MLELPIEFNFFRFICSSIFILKSDLRGIKHEYRYTFVFLFCLECCIIFCLWLRLCSLIFLYVAQVNIWFSNRKIAKYFYTHCQWFFAWTIEILPSVPLSSLFLSHLHIVGVSAVCLVVAFAPTSFSLFLLSSYQGCCPCRFELVEIWEIWQKCNSRSQSEIAVDSEAVASRNLWAPKMTGLVENARLGAVLYPCSLSVLSTCRAAPT